MSFKIESQLSENQIESDVSSYLGYITPIWSSRFRLVSVDEQLTGADKLFNKFVPIYLQFKVSQGLDTNVSIIQRFRNKPLANIISYRRENNLSCNPILYFPLRRVAKTAEDYQHNILFKLNKPPKQYALYLAPLTLEISEYEKLMNKDWFMRFNPFSPFSNKELDIHDKSQVKSIMLGSNPFLRHHISIPPHVIVLTHNHHYSYSKSGGDVAWHGGEILNEDLRLSKQLLKILNDAYNKDSWFREQEFVNFIREFSSNEDVLDYSVPEKNNHINPLSIIIDFSKGLKKKYNIKLMVLVEK